MTNDKPKKTIAILGAGSWGTALALHLARCGEHINIWSIDASEIAAMQTEKMNRRYLPGFPIPENIHPTDNLAEAIQGIEDILIAVPSVGYRDTLIKLKPLISPKTRIISASKGLDAKTGQLLNEMVEDVLHKAQPFAVLSGPSFAREVAKGLPTAVVIASSDQAFAQALVKRFTTPNFRAYLSDDVKGVEIGGVAKNVMAIAIGISDGMEQGANARCALITKGLNEIIALGLSIGSKEETFVGYSGIGDLILTCLDDQSRNRRFGLAIGRGQTSADAERDIGQAVEGKRNAELIVKLAKTHQVEMPICQTISDVLQDKIDANQAFTKMFDL